jgi:hypothetical protein
MAEQHTPLVERVHVNEVNIAAPLGVFGLWVAEEFD